MFHRRAFLGLAASVLAGCAGTVALQERAPIVFVHGNGGSAAEWQTTFWRFESNGWPRERLHAIDLPYPLARDDDAKEQPGRTSTAEHMAFLAAEVKKVLARTGAKKVALVGSSRGGNSSSSVSTAHAMKIAPELGPSAVLLVNLSGRGDKDVHTVQKCLD